MTTSSLDHETRARIREAVGEAINTAVPGLQAGVDRDPEEFLRLLEATHAAASACDELLEQAVMGARRAGLSWEAIGGVMGVTRQAAQQRFRARGPEPGEVAERRVLTGVHAFNEQAILEAEGRRCYHLVSVGPLYLVVEQSDQRWEHRRITLPSRAVRMQLEYEGWQLVARWFPFYYYKRPVRQPAEAGNGSAEA